MNATPRRILSLLALLFLPAVAATAAPELINYQGRLTEGGSLVNGSTQIVFKLYNIETNGTALYTETQTVTVVDGLYSTSIGLSNTPPPEVSDVLTNAMVYLELTVGTNTLTPRERIVSVAYALNSLIAETVSTFPMLDNVVFVAENGTSAGPGTIHSPFATPQEGYDAAATLFPGMPSTVIIASGTYGSLVMDSGTVHVVGMTKTELSALTVAGTAAAALLGKQRVRNVVVSGGIMVVPGGGDVKFHSVVSKAMTAVNGSQVEFQDCRLEDAVGMPALWVGGAPVAVSNVGVYQSSLESEMAHGLGTLTVGAPVPAITNVENFEVIGCEIVAHDLAGGAAVADFSAGVAGAVHLYTHNYIKGPHPLSPPPFVAVVDPFATSTTIGFYHNLVFGNVSDALAAGTNTQYFANNMVYGTIVNPPGGPFGWMHAGAPIFGDPGGNIEDPVGAPPPGVPFLPSTWDE